MPQRWLLCAAGDNSYGVLGVGKSSEELESTPHITECRFENEYKIEHIQLPSGSFGEYMVVVATLANKTQELYWAGSKSVPHTSHNAFSFTKWELQLPKNTNIIDVVVGWFRTALLVEIDGKRTVLYTKDIHGTVVDIGEYAKPLLGHTSENWSIRHLINNANRN
jgi:hypothetical protein